MSDDQPHVPLPDAIGRYQIKGEIGRGGMASVLHAYDPRFEREVAIKVLPRAFLHDPTFRKRFDREAKVIARLEHSGIVPVYDFGEQDEQPYLVMRYMPGGSLADKLARGGLPLDQCVRIVAGLAPALDAAHAQGIIHRDLKPGNVLFDRADEPHIADFGIAKLSEASMAFTGSTIIGTPAYMSPEQARGEADLDGRSDLYSLGAILFEMLTGRLPYEAATPMGVAMRHITDPVPRILEVNPHLPPGCDDVIARAMAKDRADRFASAADMAEALRAVASGEALAPTQLAARRASPPPPDEAETLGMPPAAAPLPTPPPSPTAQQAAAPPIPANEQPSPGPGAIARPAHGGRSVSRRNTQIALVLIACGVLAVLARVFSVAAQKFVWPLFIILPGAILLGIAWQHRGRGRVALSIVGSIVATTGLILLYQSVFNHYKSWAYAWALLVVAVGAGIALPARWWGRPRGVRAGLTVGRVGMALFVVGWLVFDALGDISHKGVAAVLWPLVLAVLGAFFLQRYLLGAQAAEQESSPRVPREEWKGRRGHRERRG